MKILYHKKILVLIIFIILLSISFNHVPAFEISNKNIENIENLSYRLNHPLPDQIDQFQNNSDEEYQIYREQYIAQTFIPTFEILTRIKILLRKTADVSLPDLFVQIENENKEFIGFSSLNSSELSDDLIWYEFNFENEITLDIGETYAIILYSYCHDISKCYEVSCSIYNDYIPGEFFTSSDGIFWDPEINVDLCFETYGFEVELIPDLDTIGSLKWTEKLKPGSTIEGTFSILNVGDTYSDLEWYIENNWDWSEININPLNGDNLKPEDGEIIVEVTIIVPDESISTFNGSLVVVNGEDSNDISEIEISVITKINKDYSNLILLKYFLNKLNSI